MNADLLRAIVAVLNTVTNAGIRASNWFAFRIGLAYCPLCDNWYVPQSDSYGRCQRCNAERRRDLAELEGAP